jgi:hypothetical protein
MSCQYAMPDLVEERPWAIPLMRPPSIPTLTTKGKSSVLNNLNKAEQGGGCLKFSNSHFLL